MSMTSGAGSPGDLRTYLGWAIASAVLCFLPTGLVSLIFGLRVVKAVDEDRQDAARLESSRARTWLVITIVVGVCVYLFIAVVLAGLGAFSS